MLFQQRFKKVGNIDNQMEGQGSFRHADTQSKGSEQNDGRGGSKMRQGLRSGGVYSLERDFRLLSVTSGNIIKVLSISNIS